MTTIICWWSLLGVRLRAEGDRRQARGGRDEGTKRLKYEWAMERWDDGETERLRDLGIEGRRSEGAKGRQAVGGRRKAQGAGCRVE